ncbi:MAG: glycoside hydrolase family 172 protein [Balneolaceae bacterium]
MKHLIILASLLLAVSTSFAQQTPFNGITSPLGDLMRVSDAKSRSISPENLTGEKGKGGMAKLEEGTASHAAGLLGEGWKVNPYINVEPGETFVLGEINESGVIQHIWMTVTGEWRNTILRMYWDDEKEPSVETPVGDFFAQGWRRYAHINSLPVSVNPGSGFNSFWQMPFRDGAKITITNIDDTPMRIYYQIDYTLTEIPDDAAYFHAQFRRVNPLPYKEDYTIIDGIEGKGHYVGTYLAHGANSPGWWGEGEVKFYMDGDTDYPTINGTGEEDYFLGSYSYRSRHENGRWGATNFTTNYAGYHEIKEPGTKFEQRRFGQYRWHILDPIRFEEDVKVTIQSLGWKIGGRYLPQQNDLASVAYWYQEEPHAPFPELPSREDLAISWVAPLNVLGQESSIRLENQPSAPYNLDAERLLDAERGENNFEDEKWLGFRGDDFAADIDLEMERAIQSVEVRFLENQEEGIFAPKNVEILASADGENYETILKEAHHITYTASSLIYDFKANFQNREIQFIKVVARNGNYPEWHDSAGEPAWIFIDEINIK